MSVTQVEKEGYSLTDIYWGGGARVLPLVVHQNTVLRNLCSTAWWRVVAFLGLRGRAQRCEYETKEHKAFFRARSVGADRMCRHRTAMAHTAVKIRCQSDHVHTHGDYKRTSIATSHWAHGPSGW